MKIPFLNFSIVAKSAVFASALLMSVSAFAIPVNINKADSALIADSLSGIGLKTAEKIVQFRQENGAFKEADGLLAIKGIGVKKLDKIRGDIKLKD